MITGASEKLTSTRFSFRIACVTRNVWPLSGSSSAAVSSALPLTARLKVKGEGASGSTLSSAKLTVYVSPAFRLSGVKVTVVGVAHCVVPFTGGWMLNSPSAGCCTASCARSMRMTASSATMPPV